VELTFEESSQVCQEQKRDTPRQAMEKLEHEFVHYQAIEDFPRIEEALWEKVVENYFSMYAYS
jgi:hypothetical protein